VSPTVRAALRGYAYLAPNFVGFLVFTALPVLAVAIMTFFQGSFTTRLDPETGRLSIKAEPAGPGALDNWRHLKTDLRSGIDEEDVRPDGTRTHLFRPEGDLRRALRNTLVLLLSVPLQMAAALGLALLLNRKIRGRVVFRTLLFLPTISAGIALFLVWRWLLNADFGLVNATLGGFFEWLGKHLGPGDEHTFGLGLIRPGVLTRHTDWLGTKELAKPALVAMGVWIAMGGTNMVLFLAGLQSIDPTLYEAAEIDGANAWQRFWHITLPELRPTTFFVFTTNLIGGFQIFDQVYIMTDGGPEGATTTLLYYIYENMYVYEGKLGYASTLAIFLFAIIFAVTLVNYWFSRGGARAVAS
jgi:multiple sugar transport system permease protein